MPIFEQATIVENEVTPQEFLDECTQDELDELVNLLKDDYPEYFDSEQSNKQSVGEQEFETMLNVLHGKWNMLSAEEEESIKNIAKRFL